MMKKTALFWLLGLGWMMTSCNAAELKPIPGSITYGGKHYTRLTKSPVGSRVENRFNTFDGVAFETYIVQPDRSLKLVRREVVDSWPPE